MSIAGAEGSATSQPVSSTSQKFPLASLPRPSASKQRQPDPKKLWFQAA
ncbi:hypothetical protein [Kingella oralis]|nr:hypothetical protein [Kingella oralis]QMT43885.1 hypothetical protein H3L93_06095 [Kingella oralis]